jgi:ribosomal protein S8E
MMIIFANELAEIHRHYALSRFGVQMGVITKGTIIEVNVSELGLVTPGGKVVWGKRPSKRH